jgi:hypothetical protein
VTGAQQTLDAATQKSMEAVTFARETLAAADPAFIALDPGSLPSGALSLPNDPNIEANFTGQVVCSQFEIRLTNRSTTTFKSMLISVSVKDDPSNTVVTSSTNGFLGHSSLQADPSDDCQAPSLSASLDAGASYTVFFPRFTEQTSTFEGSITLCSEHDLSGQCSKNSIAFASSIVVAPTAEIIPSLAPSPLASELFQAEYASTVHPCNETWWVRIHLTNRSPNTFKSMSISVKDTATREITAESDEHTVFVDLDQTICNPDIDVGNDKLLDDLEPQQSFTVSSGVFRKDLTNHPMEATLTLCTEEDLGGRCSTKTINFTPGVSVQPTVDTTKPDYAYILLREGTYCRTGPGTVYESIGAYVKDTKIPVLGRDAAGEYWVVASPHTGDTNIKCWLDGDYVKEKGNVANVEIFPVPPTPTSSPKPPTSTPTQTPTETLTPTSTP